MENWANEAHALLIKSVISETLTLKRKLKRKLEEMESANHGNFGKVMEILKEYCELKKEKKKKELEEEDKKKKKRTRLSATMGWWLCREEEERKKKKSDGEPEETLPPRQPRWSDEILAMHIEVKGYVVAKDRTNRTNDEQYLLPRNEPGAVVNAAFRSEDDEETMACKTLFQNTTFFLGRELAFGGKVLPPHLSPFVDDEAVEYVPEYAGTIKRLQVAARKEILPMTDRTEIKKTGEEDDAHDMSPKQLIT
ncbi:pescadillo [Tanacetum coccineum]